MPVEGSVRDRRRAETVQEIKGAALEQLGEAGAGALSLRGVARAVGMTVQSLYHYFDSRDALLAALVVDGHNAIADAVQEAAAASAGRPQEERLFAVTSEYRRWAMANRPAFLLLYGTPVPGFTAPSDGPGGKPAAIRLAWPFLEVVFEGWTAGALAAIPVERGAEALAGMDQAEMPLPPGALALFYELRSRMHGMVMLELTGHLSPVGAFGESLFRGMVSRMATELAGLRAELSAA